MRIVGQEVNISRGVFGVHLSEGSRGQPQREIMRVNHAERLESSRYWVRGCGGCSSHLEMLIRVLLCCGDQVYEGFRYKCWGDEWRWENMRVCICVACHMGFKHVFRFIESWSKMNHLVCWLSILNIPCEYLEIFNYSWLLCAAKVRKGKKKTKKNHADKYFSVSLHLLFLCELISTQFWDMCWKENNIHGLFRIQPFLCRQETF